MSPSKKLQIPPKLTVVAQMVEATMTVAGYNLISRFVVALNVDGMANVPLPSVQASFTTSD